VVAFTELETHLPTRVWVAYVGVIGSRRGRGVGSALVAWALEQRFDAGAEVKPETLKEKGLARRSDPVKILARGEISKKLEVHAHAFSAAAREKIEAAGGSCHTLEP